MIIVAQDSHFKKCLFLSACQMTQQGKGALSPKNNLAGRGGIEKVFTKIIPQGPTIHQAGPGKHPIQRHQDKICQNIKTFVTEKGTWMVTILKLIEECSLCPTARTSSELQQTKIAYPAAMMLRRCCLKRR